MLSMPFCNMRKPKRIVSDITQRYVAEILISFIISKDMDEVFKNIDYWISELGLCIDPFTRLPCSVKAYEKSVLEYERQAMMERFGHCDGLE